MTVDDRIAAIQRASTYAELQRAMDGYYEEAVQQFPRLAGCAPLQACLANGVYTHAVQDLQTFMGDTGETFHDVSGYSLPPMRHMSSLAVIYQQGFPDAVVENRY